MRSRLPWVRGWIAVATVLLPHAAGAAGGGEDGDPLMDLIYQAANFALLIGVIFFVARKP